MFQGKNADKEHETMMVPPLVPPSYHEKVTITQLHPSITSKYQVEFEVTSVLTIFSTSSSPTISSSPFDTPFISVLSQNINITSLSFSSSEFSSIGTPYFLSKPILSFPVGVSIQITTNVAKQLHKDIEIPNFNSLRPLLESSHLLFPLGVSARSDLMQRSPTYIHQTESYSNQNQNYNFFWNSPHPSLTYGILHSSFLHQVKKEFTYPCAYHKGYDSNDKNRSRRIGILSTLFNSWEPQGGPLSNVLISHRATYLHVSRDEENKTFSDFMQISKIRTRRILRYTISLPNPDNTTAKTKNIPLQILFDAVAKKKSSPTDEMMLLHSCPMMDTSELILQYFDSSHGTREIDSSSSIHHEREDCMNDRVATSTCPTTSSTATSKYVDTEDTIDKFSNRRRMEKIIVDLLLHHIPLNSTLADVIRNHKSESVMDKERQDIAPSLITIHRTVKQPRGIWNSGILETFVSNCGQDDHLIPSVSNVVSTNLTIVDVYPFMIRPIWYTLGISLIQHDVDDDTVYNATICTSMSQHTVLSQSKGVQRLKLSDFSSKEVQLNLNEDGSSSFSLNMNLQSHTSLYISIQYYPKFLALDHFPADPNRGFDISPSFCIIHNISQSFMDSWDSSYRIYSNSLLLMPPVPDMSMPYNVITITNSFIVLILGIVTNILTRKATTQIKNALKAIDANKEELTFIRKLRGKVHAFIYN